MSDRMIAVVSATEVEDGIEYKGTIKLGQRLFQFNVGYNCRIDELSSYGTKDERLNKTDVTVLDENRKKVRLDNEMKILVFELTGMTAYDLFYSPSRQQLRGVPDSGNPLAKSPQMRYLEEDAGGDIEFNITQNHTIDDNAPALKRLLQANQE